MDSSELHTIKWEYPINGYPELTAPDTAPALVVCQARERVEERLEVTLTGVAPSASGPKRGIKTRARTPAGQCPKSTDGVLVGEGWYCVCLKYFTFYARLFDGHLGF